MFTYTSQKVFRIDSWIIRDKESGEERQVAQRPRIILLPGQTLNITERGDYSVSAVGEATNGIENHPLFIAEFVKEEVPEGG